MQTKKWSETMRLREQWHQKAVFLACQMQAIGLRARQYSLVTVLALMLSVGIVGTAAATQTSSSTNYSVTETQFGNGSALKNCSTNYCAKESAGDTTAGSASSSSYSAQFGANTTDEPLLEVIVTGGDQDMGVLDSSTTGTAVSTIKVRNYLSSGYVMQIAGAAPSQGTHRLTTITTPSTSQPGAEQFGINLADNTAPNIGASAAQVPSGSFSFGQVISADDTLHGTNPNSDGAYFDTPDLFIYQDGDIVAHSDTSSGETDYTLSMIINVSNATPGGRYTGVYSAVVTPLY